MLRRAVAAVLLLLLLLAGCGDDGSSAADRPDPAPSYVALGDSYTAAPLITEEVVADGCLRSSANYPRLVAAELGYDLVDVSCSAATTENLRTVQPTTTGDVAPQLDALGPEVDLVTIGLGGNDGGVFSRLLTCGAAGATDAAGSPCLDRLGEPGRDQLEAAIDALGDHLTDAIDAIRGRAPEAEIVVVGYPRIIAADTTCPEVLPVAAGDLAYLAGLNERIHTVQQEAAGSAGATYVDLYDASEGHDLCADDPWVNGPVTTPGVALAFHPLAAGQVAAAELVVDALGRSGS